MSGNTTEEDIVNVMQHIYGSMPIALTLCKDISEKFEKDSFSCEWDELLFRLFSYFFYFRRLSSGVEEIEASTGSEVTSGLPEQERLLKTAKEWKDSTLGEEFIDPYPEWMKKYPAFDLLKVNLTWKLMLDLNKMCLAPEPRTLRSLYEKYHCTTKDLSQLSRKPIKEYPRIFKRSFGIKYRDRHYIIETPFPKLLVTLVEHQNDLPFLKEPKMPSWNRDINLYRDCLSVIAPNNKWDRDSYIAYYLFERLFRYNAKIRLFFKHEESRKKIDLEEKEICSRIKNTADLFFHSPLVYIPDDYIDSIAGFSDECSFHAFRVMSFYYFPAILCTAKYIISKKNMLDYKKFVEYVFPSERQWNEWDCHYSRFVPSLLDDKNLQRGAQRDRYQNIWCDFYPTNGFSKSAYKIQYI